MKAKITLLLLASAAFTSGNAQLREAQRGTANIPATVQVNQTVQALQPFTPARTAALSKALRPTAPTLKMRTAGTEAEAVITEDFSKFTSGSESSPDMDTQIFDPYYGTIEEAYLQTPGWLGVDIYQAGGSAYIGEEGMLRTPTIDLSGNDGAFKVYFRAKSTTPTATVMVINIPYGSQYYTSDGTANLTDEWQDFAITLAGGTEMENVQFQGQTAAYFLDDIRIVSEGLHAPVALPCTGFNGTSATAHWEAVDGAESYTLTLYYADASTQYYYEAFKQIEDITGTSYLIQNLETGKYYAYEVRAVKGDETSGASELIEIMSGIEAPVALPSTGYDGTSATANWEEVDGADSYTLTLYYADETTDNYFVFLKTIENLTGTSYKLEGLDPDKYYGYTVKAVKGGETSEESDIVQLMPDIAAPVALPCTNFTGTSFTANWKAVEGAESYALMLYTDDGQYYVSMWEEPVITKQTSYEVTGLESGVLYYYAVQSVDNNGMYSANSNVVAVAPDKVETPAVKPATGITETGFTANWEAVALGEMYLVNLYKEHTASADEAFDLINADFSGTASEGSLETPEQTLSAYYFDEVAGVANWYISMAALANGSVGLDNSLALLLGPSFLLSPEFDFAAYGGKATVKVKWAGTQGAESAIVTFATVDEEGYISYPTDAKAVQLPATMTEQTIQLEGGPENGYIFITSPEQAGYLMLESLQVSVDLKSGDKLLLALQAPVTQGETSYQFSNLKQEKGERYAYDVTAVYYGNGSNPLFSEPSELAYVDLKGQSGVAETALIQAKAYVNGIELVVENPEKQPVEVYNANGALLVNDRSADESAAYELPAAGVYIVKVGADTFKVIR